jgi:hypothetical protein
MSMSLQYTLILSIMTIILLYNKNSVQKCQNILNARLGKNFTKNS